MPNGDFEQFLTGEKLKTQLKYYKALDIPSYLNESRKIPESWCLSVGRWNRQKTPDMRLSDKNPLKGKWSFSVDSIDDRTNANFYSSAIPVQIKDCRYSFFIRNDDSQKASVVIQLCARVQGKNIYLDRRPFYLKAGETYRIHDKITPEQLPHNAKSFFLNCFVNGKVTIDQFCIMEFSPKD